MTVSRIGIWLLAVSVLVPAGADDAPFRIPVGSTATPPAPVMPWNPASPQRLVRLDGVLYQEEAGFYLPVIADRITVRLAAGIRSWDALVARASKTAPDTFAVLDQLVPERKNRLGIVDLQVPEGDLADWCELVFRTGLVRYAEVASHGVYLATPNDPQFSSQWALNNTGQSGGTPGADIGAVEAWDIEVGDPSVIVAVLDSGTDVDHPDLASNVWHNLGEIPNNSIDDDNNGFVDDWEGWDFGNGNNDPRSGNFHGTHVTGIINAASNNGTGIAGLAGGFGGPGVRGMALGVGEDGPIGSILDDAILYAADNGARVITMSLSVGSSSAINDALSYAYNTKDVFIDCAAGNGGSSVAYPATRSEVVAVASTDRNDVKSSFSNPGPEVEVAAPGSSILSTQPNGNYGSSSGTSFSAPYVAALAALIRSVDPNLPAPAVRQLIIDSSDDVSAPGFDTGTGWGRINAFQALTGLSVADGTIEFDAAVYACDDVLTVTVIDSDLAGAGTIAVNVFSTTDPAGETVILSEGSTGRFDGTVDTPGALQVGHADLLTAEYLDADDGAGGTNLLKTATASTDCAGPAITGVGTTGVDEASALVQWTTDEAGTSVVRYGLLVPDQPAQVAGFSTGHAVQLTGLDSCTVYRFEVESTDDLGNVSVENNGGGYYTFETTSGGAGACSEGRLTLDRNAYACSDTMIVSVTDADLGSDPGSVETLQVLVSSTSEPGGEWITLVEENTDSSRFDGSVVLSGTGASPDGQLGIAAGDLITGTYYDADAGGGPRVEAVTAVADCEAPTIRDLQVTAISASRAEISWTTDEPATSRVDFGATAALGSTIETTTLETAHRLPISAYNACDALHFTVSSVDALGGARSADANGQPFRFNLREIGGLLFHDNFETDRGWQLNNEWERGNPQSLGSFSRDPAAAFSGASVIGTDLSGSGSFAGDYEPSARLKAHSPYIDATTASNLELILRRKLGVTATDDATIAVLAPGVNQIWGNGGAVDDAEWTEVRYDISGVADGAASLRIRFAIDSDTAGQSFGWNIDEVILKDATQPDYAACGGCGGAPTFAGASAAYDPDRCALSGLTVEWEPAPAWGTGTAGTYDVHRGTAAGFTPDAGNRVAEGVSGVSWIDPAPPEDIPLWYIVRARNDEICSGGVGLPDGNVVRLPVVDTASEPLPGSIGDSLRADPVGDAHVRLDWTPATSADRYVIRRSTSPDFSAAQDVGSPSTGLFEDVGAVLDGSSYYYRVFPVNACGQETP